jgi:polysaccharide export outer membrane protein
LIYAIGGAAGPCSRALAADLLEYRLTAGDKIAVVVFGQADLSGDFTVDGGGYVQMPLVGAVPLGGLTLQEGQQRITARLGSGLIKRPVVSVRISEFRPIYILGAVRTPGAYPFRFGLSASAAISLAGGLANGRFGGLPDLGELITATERVESLSAARNATLIRLSRIEAERAHQTTVTPPRLEQSETDKASIATLIRQEQSQLTAAIAAHEELVKLLQLQQPRLQAQMEAVKQEIEATRQQLEGTRGFLKSYDKLAGAGYGRGLTQFEFQRQEGAQEATIHRLRAETSRLEVTIGDLDIRIKEAESSRQTRLMNETRESQARLQELDVALRSARQMLQLRREQNGLAAGDTQDDTLSYTINVTRLDTGFHARSIQLAKNDALNPGDIVEVARKPMGAAPGPSASISGTGGVAASGGVDVAGNSGAAPMDAASNQSDIR